MGKGLAGPAAVFLLLFSTGFSGAIEFPASEPGEAGQFDLAAWREHVAGMEMVESIRNTPVVHGDWFSGDSPELARNCLIHRGPLRVHTRMHDRSWGGYAGFRVIRPEALLDEAGELLMECFEVVVVAPGVMENMPALRLEEMPLLRVAPEG